MDKELRSWLERIGLAQYAESFEAHDIDMEVLPDLTDQELAQIGVSLGHRKRILKSVASIWPEQPQPEIGGSGSQGSGAERRQLTVMFCDLVGSTMLSVKYDPEDLRKIILEFQKCCEQVVEEFGGNVARYMGDGLLVYFGYPTADEHDAERAIRAALELIKTVSDLRVAKDLVLRTRVGIATGEVIVGDLLRGGLTQERQVVGETPNLAARLQSLAEPNSVVIGENTHTLVGGLFDYENLGQHSLKGFDRPITAWRVTEETEVEDRFEAMRAGPNLSSLVGRDEQIDDLEAIFSGVRSGRGRAVLLCGQAGIGKSRTIHAFRRRLQNAPHRTLRFFCLPYRQNSALIGVIRQIERVANISSEDSPAKKLDKLESFLAVDGGSIPHIVPLYAALLSIPTKDKYEPLALSPRLQKEHTFKCLQQHLALLSAEAPVLMIFEDLHWVDPTTLELLTAFVKQVPDLPVLLLMTARPEFSAPWTNDAVTLKPLERISEQQGASLISELAGKKAVPTEIVAQVLEKADGVPLFIEEITKTVLGSGQLVESDSGYTMTGAELEVSVPNTLQDSLMARLDQMVDAKSIVQIGAAIGRQFSRALMGALSELNPGELDAALDQLQSNQLLLKLDEEPDVVYEFKHALIQDAAYASLLREERKNIHLDIATQIRSLFPRLTDSQPDVLAHHYTEGGDVDNAVAWLLKAGTLAQSRAAHTEAIESLNKGLRLVDGIEDGAHAKQLEMQLRLALGPNLEAKLGYSAPAVDENYRIAQTLSVELGVSSERVPILLGLYVFRLVRGELSTAMALAKQCVSESEIEGLDDWLVESLVARGFVECYQGDLAVGSATLQRCVSLYRSLGEENFHPVTAQHPAVAALSLLPAIDWLTGRPDRSLDHLQSAFELAQELKHPLNFAVIHAHAAQLYQLRRETDKALQHAQLGLELSAKHGFDIWHLANSLHLGIALINLGQQDNGKPIVEQALDAWSGAGARLNRSYYLAGLAIGEAALDNLPGAMARIDEALESVRENEEHYFEPYVRNVRGEILRSVSPEDPAAAEGAFREAVQAARKYGCKTMELRSMCNLYRVLATNGQATDTRDELKRLHDSFEEGFATKDLEDADELLARSE